MINQEILGMKNETSYAFVHLHFSTYFWCI